MADEKDIAPKTTGPGPKKGSAGKFASFKVIQDGLESTLVGVGIGIMPFDQHCGGVLVNQGPLTAAALTEAAKTNPKLKSILNRFVQTSTYAQVAGALGSLLIPIAAHHGLLPSAAANLLGGAPGDVDLGPGGPHNPGGTDQSR